MIEEREREIAGVRVLWREAPAKGPAPVLYVHGVPTDGGDWVPFLERTGGCALDLPGFGRSDKPPHFDYSIPGYSAFLRTFVDELGLERFSLVVHDWGGVGLALAQEVPARVERLVAIDVVPFVPGYRWHRTARIWRTPLVGEMAMGFTFKGTFRLLAREGFAVRPLPAELLDRAWSHFDHGTQRAILKLYRSAPPQVLAAAGERLGEVTAPALVVWGAEDPYLPTQFAHDTAAALGGESRVEVLDGARHWPWIDRPETVELIAAHLL